MAKLYRKAMDVAYFISVLIAGLSLVAISAIMPWAVFTRYVLNSAASWPETAAVLLTVVITFFGAAACYRIGLHMSVTVAADTFPPRMRRVTDLIVEIMMAIIAVFMLIYGYKLCEATWNNTIAEFPWLRVGIAYSPIPVGGLITLLFIIERLTIGQPHAEADPHGALPVE
ncbi:MAG: TRAP-type C4-dicarboxylate transport system, small permease component [Pseudolabrys sp.]|nr:TRAP-type C4-dicarboxylate transport system, small permease component [Pseudolabrys sp.]